VIQFPAFVASAIDIASAAHLGQLDKAGEPYILHPLRVMLKLYPDEEAMIVGVLHDVIEDTEVTLRNIELAGYGDKIIQALDAITRREDEVYTDFILRVSGNALATKVKIADILDNLDPARPLQENERKRLRKRYNWALQALGHRQ
jgi:(p)ppGpp synthase/HD superfamily hydrolase